MASTFSQVDEVRFKQKLDAALNSASRVLNIDQRPRLASQVQHKYEDKFALAEYLVNTAIASQLHCLSRLGLTTVLLEQISEWVRTRAVSLEFCADEHCAFCEEKTEEIESKSKLVTEEKVMGPGGEPATVATSTTKVVTRVTTYYWNWECRYSIVVYAGDGDELRAVLQQGVIKGVLETSKKETPAPEVTLGAAGHSLNISWLLQNIDAGRLAPQFRIARGANKCMTPRRNVDVEAAENYADKYVVWAQAVSGYLRCFPVPGSVINFPSESECIGGFAPVWPLLIADKTDGKEQATEEEEAKGEDDFEEDFTVIEPVLESLPPPGEAAEVEEVPEASAGLAPQFTETVGQIVSNKLISTLGDEGAFTRSELRMVLQALSAFSPSELDHVLASLFRGVPEEGDVKVRQVIEHFFPDQSFHVLSVQDTNNLLAEERRALGVQCTNRGASNPDNEPTVIFLVVLYHGCSVARQLCDGLQFLEFMIRQQLIAAIGKVVMPGDFAEYMCFHNRKIFQEDFLPKQFSYAVRRSNRHAPEGVLSIEVKGTKGIAEPIMTAVSFAGVGHLMRFPLGASVKVAFRGARHIHAACLHKFSSETDAQFHLEARARQFSSMIVLIGRIASATEFHPKYAAIIKNKDDLTVPLELSTIPAPKEFRDAIESLSPEQRAFAQAYRAMQLESTLFGVLVIQIKPPMEILLGLPEGSLSQEIKLTQDLMELFITYQIPSDLLVYKGDMAAPANVKLETVRLNVLAMQDVFKQGIRAEIEEAIREGKIQLEVEKQKSLQRIADEQMRCEYELREVKERCEQQKRAQEAQMRRDMDMAQRRTRSQIQSMDQEVSSRRARMEADKRNIEKEMLQKKIELKNEEMELAKNEARVKQAKLKAKHAAEVAEEEEKHKPSESPEAAEAFEALMRRHAEEMAKLEADLMMREQEVLYSQEKLKMELEKIRQIEAAELEMARIRAMELEESRCYEDGALGCARPYEGRALMAETCEAQARCMMAEDFALDCAGAPMEMMREAAPMAALSSAAPRSRKAAKAKAQKRSDEAPEKEGGDPQNASAADEEAAVEVVDYTQIPRQLDQRFEQLDEGGCLRPTIISPGEVWTKKSQRDLLARPQTSQLYSNDLKTEKDQAFDLLSALSCSGAIVIDHASLHIVVAATHCFDKAVIDTVVEDNVNPIEKAERSTLIMATTIHKRSAPELLQQSELPRIQRASPMLFR